jgi:HD-like signal output (HDOD) protein
MPNAETVSTPRSRTGSMPANEATAAAEERAEALAFLTSLALELSAGTVDLPCFPDVVLKVSSALENPETPIERVCTIVGAEPRLAARVLQTTNSAAFNPSGRPSSDLRAAITRLGQRMIQSTAMAYAMQQIREESTLRAVARPLADLWNRSITVACICQLLARRCAVAPDEAFLTGLLHGIGRLYIMVRAANRAQAGDHRPLIELIADWHASIGKTLLENWHFADSLCEAVGAQDEMDRRWNQDPTLADVLIGSIVLADALEMPEPRVISLEAIDSFIGMGLSPDDCTAVLAQAAEQIRLVKEALR